LLPYYLEVYGPEASSDNEGVTLVDGPVCLEEVGLQEHLEPVAGQALNGVVDGQDVDPLAVLDVRALGDGDDVAETNSEVVSDDPVHADLLVGDGVVAQDDADRFLPLLSLEENGVSPEQSQLVHLGLGKRHDGVVVVDGFFDNESVGPDVKGNLFFI